MSGENSTSQAPREPPQQTNLFDVTLTVFTREFKGQTSGPKVGDWTLLCDSSEAFASQLFLKVKPLLKCEAILTDDKFEWSQLDIVEEDLERFASL